jgi:hypothetical protein
MGITSVEAYERVQQRKAAEATARRQELRGIEYRNVHDGAHWVSLAETERDALEIIQSLLSNNEDHELVAVLTWEQGDKRREEIILADRKEREEREAAEKLAKNTPVVGKGATEHMPNDARAYAVVSFGKALAEDGRPRSIKIFHLDPQALGIEVGPLKTYGDDMVIGHFFTEEEIKSALAWAELTDSVLVETARLRKDGRYYASHGCPLTFGHATDLTDYRR